MINVKRDPRLQRGTTQGQTLFWDSTLNKWVHTETSEFVWDDVNKRVGIGIDTPAGKLEVFPDTDVNCTFGRLKVGYMDDPTFADIAYIAHYDQFAWNTFALAQTAGGATYLNGGGSVNFMDSMLTYGRYYNSGGIDKRFHISGGLGDPVAFCIGGGLGSERVFLRQNGTNPTLLTMSTPYSNLGLVVEGDITAEDDLTMKGHLFTLGDDATATDIVMSFKSSGNDATITFDQSEDEFVFGNANILTTGAIQAVIFTDGTMTLSAGNLTDMGNITGPDVDLSLGTGDILTSGDITTTGAMILDDASLQIQEGVDTLTITCPTLTADRAVTFADAAGTVALTSQADGTIDHDDDLTGKDLAAAGVTYGHVDDQAQTIAGAKTFSTSITTPKINPAAGSDVVLFGDTDVANGDNGKSFIIHRKAAEGDGTFKTYINSYGVAIFEADLYSADRTFRINNLNGGEIQFQESAQGDLSYFISSSSGENRLMKQGGYITADTSSKYISWQVDDADDYFHLARGDAYILGFKVDMPLVAMDKVIFTQTDGNEYIDSLNDGYLDYGATTAHRFDNTIILGSDTSQIQMGADNDELVFQVSGDDGYVGSGGTLYLTSVAEVVKTGGTGTNCFSTLIGSIAGGDQYVSWQVQDATDTLQLTRSDAAVTKYEILMPTDIGDGTNYSKFEADGTLKFNGTATVWKDINMGAAQLARPASSQPDLVTFVDENGDDTAIQTYGFAVGEKIHGSFELQHDYKQGSDFTFHVHWQGIAAPSGTDNVQWRLIYTLMRDGATLDATTTIDSPDATIAAQYMAVRSDFAAITGTNYLIGDQFLFTLERVDPTGDAYAGDALIATVGIHYEIDTVGSRTILDK